MNRWCLNCKTQLPASQAGETDFGLSSGPGLYCDNPTCPRYGLLTVKYLDAANKRPEDARLNDPSADEKPKKEKA